MARRDLRGDAPLLRVPSTKQEVFRSRDLGLAEKRVLMKFMQRCFDEAVEDAATLNETSLNVGRALSRPQNKRASAERSGGSSSGRSSSDGGAGEGEDEDKQAASALECDRRCGAALFSGPLTRRPAPRTAPRCPRPCATP